MNNLTHNWPQSQSLSPTHTLLRLHDPRNFWVGVYSCGGNFEKASERAESHHPTPRRDGFPDLTVLGHQAIFHRDDYISHIKYEGPHQCSS